MGRRFNIFLIVAACLGILSGALVNELTEPEQARTIAGYFTILTDVFLRLIKMIIAPLVLTTLIVGIGHMENIASVGRVGAKTIGWFLAASLCSLLLGLAVVHLLQPGAGMALGGLDTGAAGAAVAPAQLSVKEFVTHLVPRSAFEALANNEILQIVVFSVFVGSAIAALEPKPLGIIELAEQGAAIMLKITGYVMRLAPFAIFAALATTVSTQGLGILQTYLAFLGSFYVGLALLWGLLALAGFLVVGPRIARLLSRLRQPALLAFSTASSEAAYPKTLEQLQAFGVSRRVSSFVLPLGYSFNLDGSMMYCTFAVLFIVQAYGLDFSWGQQLVMLLILMVTSKGIAGVPRSSLVVIAATLAHFNLPAEGLFLILAVDHLLDMGRSATNVIGNAIAAAAIAKWEGELGPPVEDPAAATAQEAAETGAEALAALPQPSSEAAPPHA